MTRLIVTKTTVSEILGSVLGLLGSFLLALDFNNGLSKWGFVSFLLSNCFWIYFSVQIKSKPLLIMQVGFTASSLLGIYRTFL